MWNACAVNSCLYRNRKIPQNHSKLPVTISLSLSPTLFLSLALYYAQLLFSSHFGLQKAVRWLVHRLSNSTFDSYACSCSLFLPGPFSILNRWPFFIGSLLCCGDLLSDFVEGYWFSTFARPFAVGRESSSGVVVAVL